MGREGKARSSQDGFTIIELLVVFVLMGIVFTLGAFGTRWYWLVRSLQGAQDQVATQMRETQQRSIAESYPNIYGIRFQPNSSNWAIVKGDLTTNTCAVVTPYTFGGGVTVVTPASGTDFQAIATLTTNCQSAAPNGNALDQVAFFYPSGSTNAATAGSVVTLTSAALGGRTRTITVSPLTGKTTRSP